MSVSWQSSSVDLIVTYLLLDLQRIHSRGELAQDLVGLLVELELGGDQIGQVAQGLGGIKDLNKGSMLARCHQTKSSSHA